ncbi:uncharacterized deoxyribonuclease [[Candida] jaroonii]|uniref:Uncharacterized deoxyribonuclease n=1 Tax=[Candida] jaroonii TaxID=467808 RepID=A0ACA9YGE2_9ASCO|nr:uncharacterized deoxyribonuclease [[Candida] jaroonii]
MDYHYLLKNIHDTHCHLSIDVTQQDVDELQVHWDKLELNAGFFRLMSTNHIDLEFVSQLAGKQYIFPYYGIHPWFSHLFGFGGDKKSHYHDVLVPPPSPELLAVLPEPIDVREYMKKVRKLAQGNHTPNDTSPTTPSTVLSTADTNDATTHTAGIGEIGLDKLFKIPNNGFLGQGPSTGLSPSRTSMAHQEAIFRIQLSLAQELQLPVSIHCVKAHGAVFDIMKDYDLPKIILHSFSGSRDQAKLWIKTFSQVYFSFSHYINGSKDLEGLLEVVGDKFLIETDVSINKPGYEQQLQGIFGDIKEGGYSEEEIISIVQRNAS